MFLSKHWPDWASKYLYPCGRVVMYNIPGSTKSTFCVNNLSSKCRFWLWWKKREMKTRTGQLSFLIWRLTCLFAGFCQYYREPSNWPIKAHLCSAGMHFFILTPTHPPPFFFVLKCLPCRRDAWRKILSRSMLSLCFWVFQFHRETKWFLCARAILIEKKMSGSIVLWFIVPVMDENSR